MSSAGKAQSVPPERGSFPLDHRGECKETMRLYMACMKDASFGPGACRDLSKAYLQCRMDTELMARDDMDKLGYAERPAGGAPPPRAAEEYGRKEGEGFIAGLHIEKKRTFFEGLFSAKPRGGHG